MMPCCFQKYLIHSVNKVTRIIVSFLYRFRRRRKVSQFDIYIFFLFSFSYLCLSISLKRLDQSKRSFLHHVRHIWLILLQNFFAFAFFIKLYFFAKIFQVQSTERTRLQNFSDLFIVRYCYCRKFVIHLFHLTVFSDCSAIIGLISR